MSLAYFTTVAFLIANLMGAAWAAPTTPASANQTEVKSDSQPKIKATVGNNRTESAPTTPGVELPSGFQEEAECRADWQKFIVDFSVQYANDEEAQKRRNIFCANWQRIQEHNFQYEAGKVSFKKKINQWSDWTIEEWKDKQRPLLAPEFDKAKPTTETSEKDQTRIKCQTAWEKFLTDYSRKYENDEETEKRRCIFCDNWQRIQEHNVLYEAGKVSHKKSINQWSDLTFEEWKKMQEPSFPPNMETSGNKTEPALAEFSEESQNKFPANMEEHGAYVAPLKPKLLNEEQLVEEESLIGKPANRELTGTQTEEAIVEIGSQEHWFPAKNESPGTYIVKTDASEDDKKGIKCQAAWEKFMIDYAPKYVNDVETEKRRSIFCDNWQRIQEHNAQFELGKVSYKESTNGWSDLTSEELKSQNPDILPPSLKPSSNKTEETIVEVGSQQVWFPPNTEEPGTYVVKTDTSEEDKKGIKCQAAWDKFLTDFSRKYENDEETEKRRSIFYDNFQRIQEHNVLYESGKMSYKKSINQWSDLTFEEWKKMQEHSFPPNMDTPGNKTEPAEAQFSEESQNRFSANMEEHGAYVAPPKPKLLNEEQLVEEKSLIEKPANIELTGNQTEEAIVEIGSQEDWFPANNESLGTYIVKTDTSENDKKGVWCQAAWEKFLIDYTPKYENDVETEKRRSIFCDNWQRIQEHNAQYEFGKFSYKKSTNGWSDLTSEELKSQNPDILPPNLKPSENKTEETIVEVGSQQVWFPPNTEEPGTYVVKTDASEDNKKGIKCQAAWEKFMIDYTPKYESDVETEKRRSIFCDNWQRIQEHNAQFELGKVSYEESTNGWSDLTSEELKSQNPDILPPSLKPSENKMEETIVEVGSQQVWFPPNTEEPGTYVVKTDTSEDNKKGIKCQAAWEKFLIDYAPKYDSDVETEKRRSIFCDNWQRIQEHNAQYELGKVSYKESTNGWSDLTSEELKSQNPDILPPSLKPSENKTEETIVEVGSQQVWFPPNTEEPGTYVVKTDASEDDKKGIKCQGAWDKFLTDFSRKYENDEETEKRRSIFCDNFQRIQEHNVLYEAGKVSHKKGINQWSDLTFEEWKKMQEHSFPPNMDTPGNKTEPAEAQFSEESQNRFSANMEEHGAYVAPPKPKLLNEEQLVEEKSLIEKPANRELTGNQTEEAIVEIGSQEDWFPANNESPDTYIVKTDASENDKKVVWCQAAWEKFLIDYTPKYENDVETEKRRSIFCDNWQRIQEHNAQYELGKVSYKESTNGWSDWTSEELKSQNPDILPANLKPSENKTEETLVEVGSQQVWFPPNMEEPGLYIAETTLEPEALDIEFSDEVRQIEDLEEPVNTKLPGTFPAKPPKKSNSSNEEVLIE